MDSLKLTRTDKTFGAENRPTRQFCRKEDFHCLNGSWDEFLSILVAIGEKKIPVTHLICNSKNSSPWSLPIITSNKNNHKPLSNEAEQNMTLAKEKRKKIAVSSLLILLVLFSTYFSSFFIFPLPPFIPPLPKPYLIYVPLPLTLLQVCVLTLIYFCSSAQVFSNAWHSQYCDFFPK